MKVMPWKCYVLIALATPSWSAHAWAQTHDGSLDPTFGGNGKVVYDIVPGQSDRIDGVTTQPNGKIVLAGTTCYYFQCPTSSEDLFVARLLTDGSLDPSFGTAGVTLLPLDLGGFNQDFAESDPIVLPTGEIVFAVTASTAVQTQGLVVRFLANGAVDPSFGIGGLALAGTSGHSGRSLARQPDGKLLLVGESYNPIAGSDLYVARFTAAGDLDPTFGAGGVVIYDLDLGSDPGQLSENAYGIAVDSAGRILVVGSAQYAGQDWDGYVLRLTQTGARDPSFGANGLAWLFLDLGGDNFDELYDLAVDPGDGVVVVGRANSGPNEYDSVILRIDSSGLSYSQFGVQGLVQLDLATGDPEFEALWGVALDEWGRIIASGDRSEGILDVECVALRLLANGSLDPSFGASGAVTIPFDQSAPPNDTDQCFGLAMEPDGDILLAGSAARGTVSGLEFDAAIARLVTPATVFLDGFESGDTSKWSGSSP